MHRPVEPKNYEVLLHVENGELVLFGESGRCDLSFLPCPEWCNWRHDRFCEELLSLAALLREKKESFFRVVESRNIFWRFELSRPSADALLLRVSQICQSREVCEILTRATTPAALRVYQGLGERILLCLDRQGDYRIVSVSERVSEMIDVKNGDGADRLLRYSLYHQSNALFDLCLRTDTMLQTSDVVFFGMKRRYLLLMLIPVNHRERHVMLSLREVTPEAYSQLQLRESSIDLPEYTPKGSLMAAFQTGGSNPAHPAFCSAAFGDLSEDKVGELLESAVSQLHASPNGEARFPFDIGTQRYHCLACRADKRVSAGFFLSLRADPLNATEATGQRLTRRELEIARYLCTGRPLRYIAYHCGVSEGTVKKTASNIYRKLGISGRVELVRLLLD